MIKIKEKIENIRNIFKKKSIYYPLLGFEVNDISYYDLAFTLTSNRRGQGKMGVVKNNERLEFLGDAVLESIVSHILFNKYPDKREGFLSSARAILVKRSTLNQLGKELKLTQYMSKNQNNDSNNLLGNIFEALVAAIYIDKGYQYAYDFVSRVYGKHINESKLLRKDKNYKSLLLEYCQQRGLTLSYELLSEERLPGNKMKFQVKVIVADKSMGNGVGGNKREAEQAAARKALQTFNGSNYKKGI